MKIQRFICRDCTYRLSYSRYALKSSGPRKYVKSESKMLKSDIGISNARQICVTETKNLVAEQERKLRVPQRTKVDLTGAIVDFPWQLKKLNRSEDTIKAYGYALKALVKVGVNLYNPQSVLSKMPLQKKRSETRKYNIAKAYRCFLNMHHIQAELPKDRIVRPMPYIPREEFLDQLIASCNHQMATFLQTLKETGARPGEVWKLEWKDLNIDGKKLHISHPEKGCNPRIRPISDKLINMLNSLPKTQERLFSYKTKYVAGKIFRIMRKRAAHKLANPELLKITFYTFRYWQATMTYRRYRDFGRVMILLGHKSLRYVLLYAQLSEAYEFDEGYICKEAHNRQEAKQLIEAGFEYVMEKDGISLFRKLK